MPITRDVILFAVPFARTDLEIVESESERTGIKFRVANEDQSLAELTAGVTSIVTHSAPIGRDIIASWPDLRLIQVMEFGGAEVDRDAAAARGVAVVTLVNLGWLGVSEHTMLLMLALMKQLPDAHVRTAAGKRKPGVSEVKTTARDYTFSWLGQEGLGWLYRKRLGLIGIGRIGRGVAERAHAFGMRVRYYAPHQLDAATEREYGLEYSELDDLLGWADFVSVHAKLTPDNERMFGNDAFARMRPDAYFINTARGALVEEDALVEALQQRSIAGAGLDVFDYEPMHQDSPLLNLDNVILTPHSAGIFNDDARVAQLKEAFDRVQEKRLVESV